MNLSKLHELFLQFPNISTDTRKVSKDCLFFALKGPNFNGNTFAEDALKKGAAYAIIDEEEHMASDKLILVDNVLVTLQKLAVFHRNYSKAKVISLTGSNGKTTTKELINAVLSKKYRTIATKGNLNNHIGVPLTLLSIKEETEIAIVEMGANHQGEIAFLSGLAQPDFGYITNFGKAHLEGFGGVQGVIKGKSELYNYLIENDKHAFFNADDAIQKEKLATYIKKIGFSQNDHQFYTIELTKSAPFVELKFEDIFIKTQLIGKYNFPNCCAAVLMGKYFNVPKNDIKQAIEVYQPDNNRSQLLGKNGHKIVLDAYNANPTSMLAALENFNSINTEHKVLFLGDMFELGETSSKEHQAIADVAKKMNFNSVYLIGENFFTTNTDFQKFRSFDDLEAHLRQINLTKSTILIKGSRGMALERTLELL
ncbi:UDP-N-acetylmuramoyl-tripeptide--D-alanyl-D-alanine ligase [Croceitalea sp. MTPC9]|uniref:UDP-N-acetylmuramoyl-tripeptide--D-alanyl-D- alanine ligase n=1 Tax=unclassified Croceitalea TaxID=2632280 RepID=UPI002B3CB35C|nr:UDP-N-acetylmuramoyl-tripeptide--D-alanyl-D-alanine ligase [Croceitalea sp. MTPC6]GMN17754.1 UDP-N-acetylmuramoyl-tripeptide--D-alanyl-D-alanine ligase [Croceitalea sp. MTPC9]